MPPTTCVPLFLALKPVSVTGEPFLFEIFADTRILVCTMMWRGQSIRYTYAHKAIAVCFRAHYQNRKPAKWRPIWLASITNPTTSHGHILPAKSHPTGVCACPVCRAFAFARSFLWRRTDHGLFCVGAGRSTCWDKIGWQQSRSRLPHMTAYSSRQHLPAKSHWIVIMERILLSSVCAQVKKNRRAYKLLIIPYLLQAPARH
jgi:hypothetical protein